MLRYSKTIFFTSCLSLLLSIYVEVTKRKVEKGNFSPLCDFEYSGYNFSCSEVMKSKYSKGFGFSFLPEALQISNSLYGIVFYSILAPLSKSYITDL